MKGRFTEGIEIGKTERDTQIVLNCHKKGYAVEQIADITGLSVEEVIEILK